jgi:hypothetical protein
MTGNLTFTSAGDNIFVLDPDGTDRTLNPTGDFTAFAKVYHVYHVGSANTITFDGAGSAQVMYPGTKGTFVYDGTTWR